MGRFDKQRRAVAEEFDSIVQGRPLFDTDDGPIYGEYDGDNDRMKYGTACNVGLIPCGDVKYHYYESVQENVERLVAEAKAWATDNRMGVRE